MNREQKAAAVDELAARIQEAETILAIDYRGISVKQAAELRAKLAQAGATFRVVKNRLTLRAADKAGAGSLKELLEGPTAFTFVRGDVALAAKALAVFRREHEVLAFKGGTMAGEPLSVEQIETLSRLPPLDALRGQLVGMLAAPLTGVVRGLGSLVGGLAIALKQVEERGLVGGEPPVEEAAEDEPAPAEEEVPAEEAPAEEAAEAEAGGEQTSEPPPEGDAESKED